MNKKLFVSLVPLLAIAAFAVMPAAAQAEPHWYIHGKLVGPAPGKRTTFKGPITFQVGTTIITCDLRTKLQVWNPMGGGAGEDDTDEFTLKKCESAPVLCPKQIEVIGNGLPWPSHLIAGLPIRDAIEGVELEFKCQGGGGGGGLPWVCRGTLTPGISENGLEFSGPGSGELDCGDGLTLELSAKMPPIPSTGPLGASAE